MLSAITQADLFYVLNLAKNLGMVAVMLGFVIFVHELGHFLVAKACGVKCEKFYIGFNFFNIPLGFVTIPATLFKVQWGETEYGIGSFPLGGYVKMLVQDDDPRNAEAEAERTKAIAEGTAAEGLISGTSVEKTTQEGLTQDSTENAGKVATQSKSAKAVKDSHGHTVLLDPRSYPAKSVPQRMAIISAGVVMNIIFGVIFAAIAYKVGVEIQPAVIGATAPGDPAWKANLQVDDRILQVGKNSAPNEHMRFMKDMMLNLALYGNFDEDLDVKVRHADGEEAWFTMRPSDRQRKAEMSRPTLGIAPSSSLEFGQVPAHYLPLMPRELINISYGDEKHRKAVSDFADLQEAMAVRSSLGLKLSSKIGNEDKLIAIDGEPVQGYADLQRLLARRAGKSIELTIERAPPKKDDAASTGSSGTAEGKYTLTLSPLPVRDFGLQMQPTPITAVQKGSPAEKAGILPGDVMVSFDGQPIGDPLAFPQKTLDKIGQTVEIELERGEKKEHVQLSVSLREPPQMAWSGIMSTAIAVETMGVAYDVTAEVAEVRSGGPADGQLRPGDIIQKVQFIAAGDAQKETEAAIYQKLSEAEKELEVDGKRRGWPSIVYMASARRLPDTTLKVIALRGEELIKAELTSVPSAEIFLDERNLDIALTPLSEMHQAAHWGEAFSLGAREVKERMTEVFTVVTKLVTGRISATNLGGPLAIITQAQREADQGVTDLLMFFTFLSANLAVINFLPIPALDGGHMVFLLYEGIRRKPVDENLQMRLSAAGILSLLALMLFVTMLDLYRFFG
jgi:regulator of sigma E protease